MIGRDRVESLMGDSEHVSSRFISQVFTRTERGFQTNQSSASSSSTSCVVIVFPDLDIARSYFGLTMLQGLNLDKNHEADLTLRAFQQHLRVLDR